MINKLLTLYRRHKEGIHYLFFGVVTTVVNFVIYYALLACGMHYIAAQIVAWIGAVIAAAVIGTGEISPLFGNLHMASQPLSAMAERENTAPC